MEDKGKWGKIILIVCVGIGLMLLGNILTHNGVSHLTYYG